MIISHSRKFIFIKPWKTAGTSVEAALSQHCDDEDIVTPLGEYPFNRDENGEWIHQARNSGQYHQHDDALTIKGRLPARVWKNYFKFSMTRNPWDRAVSFFFWEKRRESALTSRKRFYHYLGIPFDELRRTRRLFSQYLRTDVPNNDRFYIIDGQLCVDYVIRYERLAEDFKHLCEVTGVPVNGLPRMKTGMRKEDHHYSEYYDAESRAIVAKRHANDLRLFGYEFEQV